MSFALPRVGGTTTYLLLSQRRHDQDDRRCSVESPSANKDTPPQLRLGGVDPDSTTAPRAIPKGY